MYSVVDVEADEYYPTFLDLTRNLLDGKTGALYILYVRMCVCMYVCMYVHTYVYVFVYILYICMYIRMHACLLSMKTEVLHLKTEFNICLILNT